MVRIAAAIESQAKRARDERSVVLDIMVLLWDELNIQKRE